MGREGDPEPGIEGLGRPPGDGSTDQGPRTLGQSDVAGRWGPPRPTPARAASARCTIRQPRPRNPRAMTNRRRLLVTGFIALLLAASLVVGIVWLAGGHNAGQPLSSGQPTPSQSQVQRQRISGPVHAAGMRILDSSGRPVRIDALVLM